jgi:hypothetical protein
MKTVYQMFNYEMKLELGVVALNNEIAALKESVVNFQVFLH